MAGNDNDNLYAGVLAAEVYFPSTFVRQTDLEVANGCIGKYTQGLGQLEMSFCGDREDINSVSLTVVNNLLKKYNIPLDKVGRLEIGTETLLDKSKSTKTILMELFAGSGNTDIEGVTVVNACYGGTAALLNAISWVEGSGWDGRYAIVVAADIAIYSEGPARPTGGCGAVALLIGRDSPLPINMKTRTCHSTNVWDFFKPKMESEYPEVNGALSQTCYLKAIDDCYTRFVKKHSGEGKSFGVQEIDEFLFHSPYNKLVQKSFNRLVYLDMMNGKLPSEEIEKWKNIPIESTYDDKNLETILKSIGSPLYESKVAVGCHLSRQVGNTYTASLYMNLANLVAQKGTDLIGKSIVLFSYGSGAMASMFEIKPRVSVKPEFSLERMKIILDINNRLLQRQRMFPDDMSLALDIREKSHGFTPYTPLCTIDNLFPGTFYLDHINASYERTYSQKPENSKQIICTMLGALIKNQNLAAIHEDEEDIGISIDYESPSGKTSMVPIKRSETKVWASGRPNVKVVVTGVAAALPGRNKQAIITNGCKNIQRIINGENFISEIPNHVKDEMLDKNVMEVVKDENGKLVKRKITKHEDGINLCAALGKFSLSEYGVSESIASTMDLAVQVSVACGLEALKNAGICNGEGPNGWELPLSMQNSTGVVFATSFPALDTAIGEVSKFYESKSIKSSSSIDIINILRKKFEHRSGGSIPKEVETAIEALVLEATKPNALEVPSKPYEFDRKFLFRVLVLGNAQLAQIIKARGPNMQTNAACAGATQAIALAYDMIQVGRAERVVVIAGDNASSDTLMPWIGNGFRALGAATICSDVKRAAMPFNPERSGMILGSGGIGIILESEEGARRRFDASKSDKSLAQLLTRSAPFSCRLLGTLISNSAYHGASMDKSHIAEEMERFIAAIEKEQGISRRDIARNGVYFSHETSTHASPTSSCAFNELYGLRRVFGPDFSSLLILNTKGFTGHPMGVSFEDCVAAAALESKFVPPLANFTEIDPFLNGGRKSSGNSGENSGENSGGANGDKVEGKVENEVEMRVRAEGGHYNFKFALRFAAGFGSQIALALYGSADSI